MTTKNIKVSKSVCWIFAMVLLTASKVWAEDDIPPIYPLGHSILKWLQEVWMQISGGV